MQSFKILLTLVALVVLGIIVGSNLIPTMTVTILNQATMELPIGLWLAIAIGLGLLSSSIIQLAVWLERRPRDRQIRKLQARLQQDEDLFTYKSASPQQSERVPDPVTVEPPAQKKTIFSSYRSPFSQAAATPNDRLNSQPERRSSIAADDWEDTPVSNRELDWDDDVLTPPQQPNATATSFERPAPTDRTQIHRDEVYDADFRLVQPPYRQPPPDELDYRDDEEEEQLERDATAKNTDDEDWGFDFDTEDTPQKSRRNNRR